MMSLLLLATIMNALMCINTLNEHYFISPAPFTNGTCSDSGSTTLRPCYSLQQLSNGNELLFNKSGIILILLPGTHVLPENHTLMFSNVNDLNISPQSQEQEQFVLCHSSANNIIFQDIRTLSILALSFLSCSISISSNVPNFASHIIIFECNFTESKDYAVAITSDYRDTQVSIYVSVSTCTFLSNNGALSCNVLHAARPSTNIVLSINDTTFLNNQRTSYGGTLEAYKVNLTIQRSLFINNSASYGGVIGIEDSSTLVNGTFFINNCATASGGAIFQAGPSSLEIYDSVFEKNSAMGTETRLISRDM